MEMNNMVDSIHATTMSNTIETNNKNKSLFERCFSKCVVSGSDLDNLTT